MRQPKKLGSHVACFKHIYGEMSLFPYSEVTLYLERSLPSEAPSKRILGLGVQL